MGSFADRQPIRWIGTPRAIPVMPEPRQPRRVALTPNPVYVRTAPPLRRRLESCRIA